MNIQNFVSMLRLLIPRLKDSSVKLQAEEVSCVRPETQGDYFDIPAKKPYYTKEDLEKEELRNHPEQYEYVNRRE